MANLNNTLGIHPGFPYSDIVIVFLGWVCFTSTKLELCTCHYVIHYLYFMTCKINEMNKFKILASLCKWQLPPANLEEREEKNPSERLKPRDLKMNLPWNPASWRQLLEILMDKWLIKRIQSRVNSWQIEMNNEFAIANEITVKSCEANPIQGTGLSMVVLRCPESIPSTSDLFLFMGFNIKEMVKIITQHDHTIPLMIAGSTSIAKLTSISCTSATWKTSNWPIKDRGSASENSFDKFRKQSRKKTFEIRKTKKGNWEAKGQASHNNIGPSISTLWSHLIICRLFVVLPRCSAWRHNIFKVPLDGTKIHLKHVIEKWTNFTWSFSQTEGIGEA